MNEIINNNSFISNDVKGSFLSQFLNKELLQKKIKAFSTHLLLSTLLITAFFLFAILYWFPNSSFELSGIKNILIIILAVDLILGPALTFLVFNPIKKSLKFDLSAIVFLQLLMFCYGIYTVYAAHPVYITFTVDRFTLVSARDASPSNALFDEYKVSKLSRPTFAYVESPNDPNKQQELMFNSIAGGLDLEAYSEYYTPYRKNIHNIIKRGWSANDIFINPAEKKILNQFLKHKELKLNDVTFLPVQGKEKFMTFAVDIKTAIPVHAFDIDPWESNKQLIK